MVEEISSFCTTTEWTSYFRISGARYRNFSRRYPSQVNTSRHSRSSRYIRCSRRKNKSSPRFPGSPLQPADTGWHSVPSRSRPSPSTRQPSTSKQRTKRWGTRKKKKNINKNIIFFALTPFDLHFSGDNLLGISVGRIFCRRKKG